MDRLASLLFILLLSAQARAASSIEIGFLPDEKPNFCGCLAWLGKKTFAKGKLIYSQVSPTKDKVKYSKMKINGKSLELKQTRYVSLVPETYEEELGLGSVAVHSVWKGNSEYAGFDVKFDVKSGEASKSLSAVGSCGCDSN
jgi:hypothetical protein